MQQASASLLRPGDEPLPGYRLLAPLGEGGFGVVWKCRAPGGLHKAIKFVRQNRDGACPATQELAALERVKELRHPFLLSLERVEVQPDGTVVIVMELADESLHALAAACQEQGLPGVPRDELLAYLAEAAEALDWMNEQFGLQHLDVKPHNLFIVSGHVKVADFGLVHQLGEAADGPRRHGGVTPLYSSPEILRGTLSRTSDQYSLAVVYQQMLTGTVPFWHEDIHDLMMQHLSGEPDLSSLGEADRPVVARALAKGPEQRYGSCQAFVAALRGGPPPQLRRSGAWRRVLTGPSPAEQKTRFHPPATLHAPPPGAEPAPADTPTKRIRAVPPPVPPSRLPGSGRPAAARIETVPPAGGPAPTAITLPGFRFLRCLAQGPLGDLWRAEDDEGRPRRAVALLPFVRYDARLIAHLRALRDLALPPAEVHWSPAERLIVLTDTYEGTLRDRLERRQAEGHAGIPRAELLGLLRWAAVALDGLQARHALAHLNLHPHNLLVQGDRLWLAEFGLVPLLWLPTGQSAAALNRRYAAPELYDRRPSRSADQYSLALIYAEMLTGAGPRVGRASSARVGRPGGPAIDLELVPARDREAVRVALSADPAKRFASCTAFVEALEEAGAERAEAVDLYDTLPPVIPYASLLGEPAGPDTVLPTIAQLVRSLTGSGPRWMTVTEGARCRVLPDGSWEHRCTVELPFAEAMGLMVEGLRAHWDGRLTARGAGAYRLVIDLEVPRGFWERYTKKARRLEVDVEVPAGEGARRAEAVVRVRYQGERGEAVVAALAPRVFESAREYFRAAPELRARDRVALDEPVRVYPVRPDLELGDVLTGECRDISAGGVRFFVRRRPQTDYLYLHLYAAPQTLGYAIHARVARVAEAAGGVEVGARFVGPLPS